ncbi:MAG TPA: RNA pseudouridine synthase [Leptospiraceae bacterium]|nr:RNA pseudouridine synthase [Spirochaetaceae bacterium]HBS06956.1 RNA pseudouridine synthase [Leptospiraceae bacterium]|tara:strand:- start:44695 stop:45447 length:753 start_codon:yes stop_codon:yes gene_type:complete
MADNSTKTGPDLIPEILYEDNHILVVIKPPGLLSQADSSGHADIFSVLKDYIKQSRNKPGNVYLGLLHRLDRSTGGIMVFALTSKAAARLSEEIRKSRLIKKYLALLPFSEDQVRKSLGESEGELVDIYRKDEASRMAIACKPNEPGAREARLRYRLRPDLSPSKHSVLEIDLITGRFHQIRFQLSSRGLPLCGEARYANQGLPDFRLGLWAFHLEFDHPVGTDKRRMIFERMPSEEWWKVRLQSPPPGN